MCGWTINIQCIYIYIYVYSKPEPHTWPQNFYNQQSNHCMMCMFVFANCEIATDYEYMNTLSLFLSLSLLGTCLNCFSQKITYWPSAGLAAVYMEVCGKFPPGHSKGNTVNYPYAAMTLTSPSGYYPLTSTCLCFPVLLKKINQMKWGVKNPVSRFIILHFFVWGRVYHCHSCLHALHGDM